MEVNERSIGRPRTAPATRETIGPHRGNARRWPEELGCTRELRRRLIGREGATVWFTGLPGAGKSTLATMVERELLLSGVPAYVLDGDNLRRGLSCDLAFTPCDRAENVRRVAHVARVLADAGVIAVVAVISPYAADRRMARALHEQGGHKFLEVWVDTPLNLCERRDPKGLYSRARDGAVVGMTGVDAPYEIPVAPDLRLRPQSLRSSTRAVLDAMAAHDMLPSWSGSPERLADRRHSTPVALTLREREILALIELGLANKEIAWRLSIRPSTVKNHVHHILRKLDADRRGQAVLLARSNRL